MYMYIYIYFCKIYLFIVIYRVVVGIASGCKIYFGEGNGVQADLTMFYLLVLQSIMICLNRLQSSEDCSPTREVCLISDSSVQQHKVLFSKAVYVPLPVLWLISYAFCLSTPFLGRFSLHHKKSVLV